MTLTQQERTARNSERKNRTIQILEKNKDCLHSWTNVNEKLNSSDGMMAECPLFHYDKVNFRQKLNHLVLSA